MAKKETPEKTDKKPNGEVPEKKPKAKDTPQEIALRYNFFKAQTEQDIQELRNLGLIKNDHLVAKATLENIKNIKEGNELLLPLGGNVFVNATISSVSDVFMDVGSNVILKKSAADAISKLTELLEELSKREKDLVSNIKFYENEMQDLMPKIQAIQQQEQAQQAAASKNK